MKSMLRNLIVFAAVLIGSAVAKGQSVDPGLDINWPTGCNSTTEVYVPFNNSCLIPAGGGGTVTYTASQTGSSADNGKLVVMNCASACAYTFPATQPSAVWFVGVISEGSTTATIVLGGGDTFNGSASVPVLNKYRILWVFANSGTATDYRGEAPLVAGTNVTLTPASNGVTVSATGGGGGGTALCSVNAQTGTSYTLVLTDGTASGAACIGTVTMSNAAVNTATVPPNSSVAFPTPDEIDLIQLGVGQTCFAAGVGVTLTTPTSLCTRAQNSTIGIRQIAANTWIVFGDTQ